MDAIAIYSTLILLLVGVGIMVGFGVRNIVSGKHDWQKIGAVMSPFVILGITLAVTGDGARAAIYTLFIMISILALALLFNSLRSTFRF